LTVVSVPYGLWDAGKVLPVTLRGDASSGLLVLGGRALRVCGSFQPGQLVICQNAVGYPLLRRDPGGAAGGWSPYPRQRPTCQSMLARGASAVMVRAGAGPRGWIHDVHSRSFLVLGAFYPSIGGSPTLHEFGELDPTTRTEVPGKPAPPEPDTPLFSDE